MQWWCTQEILSTTRMLKKEKGMQFSVMAIGVPYHYKGQT